jgi:hypothetical protein
VEFSEQEFSALKGKDDLVTQLVAKYGLEKAQAQRDVDALLKGRRSDVPKSQDRGRFFAASNSEKAGMIALSV